MSTSYITDVFGFVKEIFYLILPWFFWGLEFLIVAIIVCYILFILYKIIFDKAFKGRYKFFKILSVALLVMTIFLTIKGKQVNPGFDVIVALGTTIIAIAEILIQNYTGGIKSVLFTWIRRLGFIVILIAYYLYFVGGAEFSYASSQIDSGKIGIIGIALLLLSIAVESEKSADNINKEKIHTRLVHVFLNCKIIPVKGKGKKKRRCKNCDYKGKPDFYKYEKVT